MRSDRLIHSFIHSFKHVQSNVRLIGAPRISFFSVLCSDYIRKGTLFMKHLIIDNAKRRRLFNQREADNVSCDRIRRERENRCNHPTL